MKRSQIIFKNFIPLIILTVVGIFVFWSTFSLGVFGDNWLVFWGGKISLGKSLQWTNWLTYFSPYGFSHVILFWVGNLWGYSGTALYVLSFICRLFAAFTFYYFLVDRKFKSWIALVASLLLLISPIGLEVTDWVFQMTSYISMGFMFLGLYFIFSLNSLKRVILLLLSFFLAVGLNPIRAHGMILIFWLPIIFEIIISDRNKKKLLLLSFASSLLIFWVMLRSHVLGDSQNTMGMLSPGIEAVKQSISSKNPSLILNLLASVGNSLIPNPLIDLSQRLGSLLGSSFSRRSVSCLALPIIALLALVWWKKELFKNGKSSRKLLIFLAAEIIALFIMTKSFASVPAILSSILLGVVFLNVMLFFIITDLWRKNFSEVRIEGVAFLLSFVFILLPWLHSPTSSLPSSHRYLIYSAPVLPIMLGILIQTLQKSFHKSLFIWPINILVIAVFLFPFLIVTSSSIKDMNYRHGQDYTENVWKEMDIYLKDVNFDKRKTLFYFLSDDMSRLHDGVTFGFGFHSGLRYGIWKQDDLPIAIDNADDLKSMVTDGKASARYIGKEYVYPESDVYVLKVMSSSVQRLKLKDVLQGVP